MEIFRTHLIVRRFIPDTAAIAANFDTLRPMPSTTVSPAAHVDGTIVDDDGFVDGMHNRGRDRHVLDGEAIGVGGVVLANLGAVI